VFVGFILEIELWFEFELKKVIKFIITIFARFYPTFSTISLYFVGVSSSRIRKIHIFPNL